MPDLGSRLRGWLAHPLTRGLDIDDPATTGLRQRIIREKLFLRKIYDHWYADLASALPDTDQPALELGSGAGFLADIVPNLITSDIFGCPGVQIIADARQIPLPDQSLRGVVMVDVLHHIAQPRELFAEAARCVSPGGVVCMVEPWVSTWSRLVYTHLHHEPFGPGAIDWTFPEAGPLSGANGALPWIMFQRDRPQFETEFPQWKIERVQPHTPFRYLVSGGVSMRTLSPGWSHGVWRIAEQVLRPLNTFLSMFATVILRRI